jgi:peptide/nickel transport system substrate-binding protein
VRDPMWYRASEGVPYLDSIVFRVVPDQNTILKDLQAGSIDSAWFLDVSKTPAYQRLTNYKLSSNQASTNFEAAYFNFKNPILGKHLEVRQAIAMAIDHQAMINVARRGQAAPLCTDHSAGLHPGYQADAPCPKLDPAAANALLDQNGWAKGSDGYRSKGGQRLEFQYSTTANNLWRADDELIIQQNLKAIGIKIDIQNYPASTFFGTFLNSGIPGKYDIAEFENSWTYDADDSSAFASSQIPPNGFNITFYSNPKLDALFVQEESTADPTQRQQIFNQIHQIYLTDFPFITLYGPVDLAMNKAGTHNYTPGPEGASETVNNWEWWCDGGKC